MVKAYSHFRTYLFMTYLLYNLTSLFYISKTTPYLYYILFQIQGLTDFRKGHSYILILKCWPLKSQGITFAIFVITQVF